MATATIKKRTGDWFAETDSVTLVLTANEAFAIREVLNLVLSNATHGGDLIVTIWNELLKMNIPISNGLWIETCPPSTGRAILQFRAGHCQTFLPEPNE